MTAYTSLPPKQGRPNHESLRNAKPIRINKKGDVGSFVGISGAGRYVACADVGIEVWDATTGEEKASWKVASSIHSLALSSDGGCVASGHNDGSVALWDSFTGQQRMKLNAHVNVVIGLEFSLDSNLLATCTYCDASTRIWDTTNGKEILVLKDEKEPRNVGQCLALFPDGKRIITSREKNIIWDIFEGRPLMSFRAPFDHRTLGLTYCVAVSADGRFAATGEGQTVGIWESCSGRSVCRLGNFSSDVGKVALSPDGSLVIVGVMGENVTVFDVDSGEEIVRLLKPGERFNDASLARSGGSLGVVSFDYDLHKRELKIWKLW